MKYTHLTRISRHMLDTSGNSIVRVKISWQYGEHICRIITMSPDPTILHKNVVRKRWEYAVTRAASEIARSGYSSAAVAHKTHAVS